MLVGLPVGTFGAVVGKAVGLAVGAVGAVVGWEVGLVVGNVGAVLGADVGAEVGLVGALLEPDSVKKPSNLAFRSKSSSKYTETVAQFAPISKNLECWP